MQFKNLAEDTDHATYQDFHHLAERILVLLYTRKYNQQTSHTPSYRHVYYPVQETF